MSKHITDAQKCLILITVSVAFIYLVYLLVPVLMPFIISAFLAYLGDPAVDKLQTIKFSRTLSVIFVFFLMILIAMSLLMVVIPLLEEQLRRLINRLPIMLDWIQSELMPWLSHRFGLQADIIEFEGLKQSLTNYWQTLSSLVRKFLMKMSTSGQLLLLWTSYMLLIPVVTFYLLRDWDLLVAKINASIPNRFKAVVNKLTKECDAVLSEFLRGQLLVMLGQGIFYCVGLWVVGLEFSLLIGFTAGMVSFVPYLGVIVGLLIAVVAAFMQFHDVIHIVYVFIVFGAGQMLEGMLLTPLLIGNRIGLHPVTVIFSVMAGAQLFGFFGMLVALPLAAVITVLFRHFHEQYLESNLYQQ